MNKTGPREPHYITRKGARALQDELVELRTKQRPKVVSDVADAAAMGDRSENAEYIYGKKRLREIDRRGGGNQLRFWRDCMRHGWAGRRRRACTCRKCQGQ